MPISLDIQHCPTLLTDIEVEIFSLHCLPKELRSPDDLDELWVRLTGPEGEKDLEEPLYGPWWGREL